MDRSSYDRLKEEFLELHRNGETGAKAFAGSTGIPYWTVRDWMREDRVEDESIRVSGEASPSDVVWMMALSGLSMRSFANAAGIRYYTLRSWHRKERDTNPRYRALVEKQRLDRGGSAERPASGR